MLYNFFCHFVKVMSILECLEFGLHYLKQVIVRIYYTQITAGAVLAQKLKSLSN